MSYCVCKRVMPIYRADTGLWHVIWYMYDKRQICLYSITIFTITTSQHKD